MMESERGGRGERRSGRIAEIGDCCFQYERADLRVVWNGDFSGEPAGEGGGGLLGIERENPGDHEVGFVHGVLRMREHGDFSPDPGGAFDDALGSGEFRGFVAAIEFCDFHEGGADEFAINGVAVEAIGFCHEAESRVGGDIFSIAADPVGGDESAG